MRIPTISTFFFVFLYGFVLNFVWEFAQVQAGLYMQYQGGEITRWILLRAALFDASFITALAVLFFSVLWLRTRLWLAFIFGTMFAIGLEWFALSTGRWEYSALMPVIPFLNTGLSPTIQLGITAWVSLKLSDWERT